MYKRQRQERYIFPFIASAALLVGIILSGIDNRLRNAAAAVFGLYMLAMCPFTMPQMDYKWDAMRDSLKSGAVLYRLNPNELPQIAPALNDTVRYRLISASEDLAPTEPLPVVSRIKPPLDTIATEKSLTGPLKLYRR